MAWKISQRDFKVGGGCLYHGNNEYGKSDFDIAHQRARFLQMKMNTTFGEEKREWIRVYRIKSQKYLKKSKKIGIRSKLYLDLKTSEILDIMLSKKKELSIKIKNN